MIEGTIERTERRERKRKQMLDDFKETRRERIERGSTTSHSEENSVLEKAMLLPQDCVVVMVSII